MSQKMRNEIVISSSALSQIKDVTTFVHPGSIYLFQGHRHNLHSAIEELIERLALRGDVHVVAGGNWVSFERLPFLFKTGQGRIYEVLDHILVSRAETCYQMADVLSALKPTSTPLAITDMLDSFDDEDLTDAETSMLLDKCIARLQLLSRNSPVLISTTQLTKRPTLAEKLEQIAHMSIFLEPTQKRQNLQPELF